MYQLSKWMPIVTSTLVVAAVGATGLGCDAVNCGDGTIERDGVPIGWAAIIRLAVITVICIAIAARRLARIRPLAGDE